MERLSQSGTIQTNFIGVASKSGRDTSSVKKARVGTARPGLAAFLHPRPVGEYRQRPVSDTDLALLYDYRHAPFFGITAVTGDRIPEINHQTIAVGGTVNVLNTSKWPIHQFDTVVAIRFLYDLAPEYEDQIFNSKLDLNVQCALVCSEENVQFLRLDADRTEIFTIGTAMSNESGMDGRNDSYMFSMLLFEPVMTPAY